MRATINICKLLTLLIASCFLGVVIVTLFKSIKYVVCRMPSTLSEVKIVESSSSPSSNCIRDDINYNYTLKLRLKVSKTVPKTHCYKLLLTLS